MTSSLVLTRDAALQHLAAVAPRTGRAYAAHRNTDAGRDAAPTTTALSPFLRRRLVLEQEAVAAALAAHGPEAAGKFVDEVFWRTYFKGYLESHPVIWSRYLDAVATETDRLAANAGLRRALEQATTGHTGIECIDDWARELTETGWLHNHTRMWFASIWIFTLRLPWVLGADFFLRHLLDGDPASNTLSWRWVAGLHTPGKNYVARAGNIERYTDGRYAPTGLAEDPAPLEETDRPAATAIPQADAAPSGEIALLLHGDDLHPESLDLGTARVVRIGGLVASAPNASDRVRDADEAAMADALARAAHHFGCDAAPIAPDWNGGLPIVAAWAPVGPSADALPSETLRLRRRWDDLTWPCATKGYFKVRSAIPGILRELVPG